jgi:hypothetical protein
VIKVKIWHCVKHDDFNVTEMEYDGPFGEYLHNLYGSGGLRVGEVFIPWHRINYIESTPDDPYHDEGNATNHRLSQCSERCR